LVQSIANITEEAPGVHVVDTRTQSPTQNNGKDGSTVAEVRDDVNSNALEVEDAEENEVLNFVSDSNDVDSTNGLEWTPSETKNENKPAPSGGEEENDNFLTGSGGADGNEAKSGNKFSIGFYKEDENEDEVGSGNDANTEMEPGEPKEPGEVAIWKRDADDGDADEEEDENDPKGEKTGDSQWFSGEPFEPDMPTEPDDPWVDNTRQANPGDADMAAQTNQTMVAGDFPEPDEPDEPGEPSDPWMDDETETHSMDSSRRRRCVDCDDDDQNDDVDDDESNDEVFDDIFDESVSPITDWPRTVEEWVDAGSGVKLDSDSEDRRKRALSDVSDDDEDNIEFLKSLKMLADSKDDDDDDDNNDDTRNNEGVLGLFSKIGKVEDKLNPGPGKVDSPQKVQSEQENTLVSKIAGNPEQQVSLEKPKYIATENNLGRENAELVPKMIGGQTNIVSSVRPLKLTMQNSQNSGEVSNAIPGNHENVAPSGAADSTMTKYKIPGGRTETGTVVQTQAGIRKVQNDNAGMVITKNGNGNNIRYIAATNEALPKTSGGNRFQSNGVATYVVAPRRGEGNSVQVNGAAIKAVVPVPGAVNGVQSSGAATNVVIPKIGNANSVQGNGAASIFVPPKIGNGNSLQANGVASNMDVLQIDDSNSLQGNGVATKVVIPKIGDGSSLQGNGVATNVVIPKIGNANSVQGNGAASIFVLPNIGNGNSVQGNGVASNMDVPQIDNSNSLQGNGVATNVVIPKIGEGNSLQGNDVETNVVIPLIGDSNSVEGNSPATYVAATMETDTGNDNLEDSGPSDADVSKLDKGTNLKASLAAEDSDSEVGSASVDADAAVIKKCLKDKAVLDRKWRQLLYTLRDRYSNWKKTKLKTLRKNLDTWKDKGRLWEKNRDEKWHARVDNLKEKYKQWKNSTTTRWHHYVNRLVRKFAKKYMQLKRQKNRLAAARKARGAGKNAEKTLGREATGNLASSSEDKEGLDASYKTGSNPARRRLLGLSWQDTLLAQDLWKRIKVWKYKFLQERNKSYKMLKDQEDRMEKVLQNLEMAMGKWEYHSKKSWYLNRAWKLDVGMWRRRAIKLKYEYEQELKNIIMRNMQRYSGGAMAHDVMRNKTSSLGKGLYAEATESRVVSSEVTSPVAAERSLENDLDERDGAVDDEDEYTDHHWKARITKRFVSAILSLNQMKNEYMQWKKKENGKWSVREAQHRRKMRGMWKKFNRGNYRGYVLRNQVKERTEETRSNMKRVEDLKRTCREYESKINKLQRKQNSSGTDVVERNVDEQDVELFNKRRLLSAEEEDYNEMAERTDHDVTRHPEQHVDDAIFRKSYAPSGGKRVKRYSAKTWAQLHKDPYDHDSKQIKPVARSSFTYMYVAIIDDETHTKVLNADDKIVDRPRSAGSYITTHAQVEVSNGSTDDNDSWYEYFWKMTILGDILNFFASFLGSEEKAHDKIDESQALDNTNAAENNVNVQVVGQGASKTGQRLRRGGFPKRRLLTMSENDDDDLSERHSAKKQKKRKRKKTKQEEDDEEQGRLN
jgi:hypothetical protein